MSSRTARSYVTESDRGFCSLYSGTSDAPHPSQIHIRLTAVPVVILSDSDDLNQDIQPVLRCGCSSVPCTCPRRLALNSSLFCIESTPFVPTSPTTRTSPTPPWIQNSLVQNFTLPSKYYTCALGGSPSGNTLEVSGHLRLFAAPRSMNSLVQGQTFGAPTR